MTKPEDLPANVLLVDDQPSTLTALEAILEGLHIEVVKASSGEEALRRVLEDDFAVILLDVQMKGLDGFETAKLIRGRKRSRHTPIIFLTAYEDPAFPIARAYDLGAVDYLLKPVAPSILRSKVVVFVELFEKTRQIERQAHLLRALQQEQLRVTLASIGDAVLVTDCQSRVTFINRVAAALTGWGDEAVGQPLSEIFRIVHERTRQPAVDPVARALRDGTIVGLANHTVLLGRDGTERPIEDSAAPIRDEQGVTSGVVLVFRDVTERRRADEARARLAAIVESSEDAIIGKTLDGVITSWNHGAERLYGYTAAEAVGRPIEQLLPAERREELTGIMDRIRGGQHVPPYETVRQRKDGGRVDVLVSVSPIQDAGGRIVGASTIAQDISARKRAEEERAELLLREQQARAEAEAAAREVREADRRKDDFLAMLAHELRNPMAPILTGLHILRRTGGQGQGEVRAMLERQVLHLSRLVDDLLDVSRIARGKITIQPERLDLVRLVRTTADDRRPVLERAGLTLAVETPQTPVWVQGDSTRLAQVLTNLLDNAAKFSDRNGHVRVRLTRDDDRKQAVLAVRDTGIGIEPEMLPRLFTTFAQADRSLERTRGGLGLGLALVKGLVELHGGEVQAASAGHGQGAEFSVRLPFAEEPAALAETGTAPAQAAVRRRVLVVEDNRDAAESLRLLLGLLGHEVEVAYTGPDGVRLAEEWRPEVVLCDIGLPGLDGYGVAEELRRNPGTAGTRLIAITGYGQDEDRRRSRRAGFDHHLTKPVDPEVLVGLLTGPMGAN